MSKDGRARCGDELGMNKVIKYLAAHQRLIFEYPIHNGQFQVECVVDSDHAGCMRTRARLCYPPHNGRGMG